MAMASSTTMGGDVLSAVVPLLKLLSVTAFGLILARAGIVPRATFRLLSKLVFALFLPCIIFVHLGPSITFHHFARWWFVPANVLLSTALGLALGYAVALLCRPPPRFFRLTVIATAFGNTGNLPIALVGSLCRVPDNPLGPQCHHSGIAYLSFSQWVAVLLTYTLVYHMMEPPIAFYEVVSATSDADNANAEGDEEQLHQPLVANISQPLLHEAEWPGIADQETQLCKTPFIARVFASLTGTSAFPDLDLTTAPTSPKSVPCLAEPKVMRRIRIVAERTPIQHMLQPPTIASLLAIIIGMVPIFRDFVFGNDAPLSFFTDSLDILAGAMVPSVMLILGGMLAEGSPSDSALGIRTTVGITVARLLVLPCIGIGVVTLADKFNFLIPGDNMYRFVLLLQYTTPSAILLGAIASLRGYAVKEASALLFWQHVCAVFSLSLYIVVYFKWLSDGGPGVVFD